MPMNHPAGQSNPNSQDTHQSRRVNINGADFDESFLASLIAQHFSSAQKASRVKLSDAFEIYIRENPSSHRKKFLYNASLYFGYFMDLFGDVAIEDLRHHHITAYRDFQLARGLKPSSIRKHNNTLNAIINMAFKHYGIDRLSPFRGLRIKGEHERSRELPKVTEGLIQKVKSRLLESDAPYRLVALIQLNTGMRVSEPALARLHDLVLDHEIPHLWVRRNELTDRKTASSLRAVPLCGISLDAARKLHRLAQGMGSDWLVPSYAHENGNTSCSAMINKCLRDLDFRSHMFRHAFIDRLKSRNDVPLKLAECITGHHSGGSDFDHYGTVGYSLHQKQAVIQRILI